MNSKKYRAGPFAFNSNGDMIVEYSVDNSRLFYGLKSNGKYYFKDSSQNGIPSKEITYNYDSANRYESKNIFVSVEDAVSASVFAVSWPLQRLFSQSLRRLKRI